MVYVLNIAIIIERLKAFKQIAKGNALGRKGQRPWLSNECYDLAAFLTKNDDKSSEHNRNTILKP
ncbi:MAG: hypothetical protein V3V00_08875 [Saprospiraceae bacterium]